MQSILVRIENDWVLLPLKSVRIQCFLRSLYANMVLLRCCCCLELNINREERLNAVRLRQENLLAQQRLKKKLAKRERQRRDKKQHAMLMAQQSTW